MGADGHIIIYDLEQILTEMTRAELDKLLGSQVYMQEMRGKQYLTVYFGDNLCYNAESYKDQWGWCKEPDITAEEWDRLWGIVNKHRITEWEVWT